MVLLCLLWCLWSEKKKKKKKIENRERTLEETLLFKTLYLWVTVYVSPLYLTRCSVLYIFLYIWERLTFLMIYFDHI
jgi:hypothetical protein